MTSIAPIELCARLMPQPRQVLPLTGELRFAERAFFLQVEGAWSASAHQALGTMLSQFSQAPKNLAMTFHEPSAALAEIPVRAVIERAVSTGDGVVSTDLSTVIAGAEEHYRIDVLADEIRLQAITWVGMQRAQQTLAQLLTQSLLAGVNSLPCVRIDDAPEQQWRGLLIDVARHFIELPALLRTLDGMAHHKLNVLHLHLTDDQAFRFPSRAFPALNAGRPAYLREELELVVAHAASLGIRVVPELDMPGHVTCWLAAYPQWSLFPVEATTRFGVHPACLDACSEQTYDVIGTLLDEFAEVFTDDYVHTGGDEVHPRWWREHAGTQAFMQAQGFAEPRDLQAYFNTRVGELLTERGKQTLAWDEAVHKQLPTNTLVQAWRGMTARDAALDAGYNCIVSAPYYLDLFYPADLHTAFAPLLPLAEAIVAEDAMLADERLAHVAGGLEWTKQWRSRDDADQSSAGGRVIGAEACLWSELVDNELLDVRLWSRLPLLAELFWSNQPNTQDYTRLVHSLTSWRFCGGPDLVAALCGSVSVDQLDLLAPTGITEQVAELLTVVEPVKWYARLLGAQALAARLQGSEMPQARPYHLGSPLRDVADVLSPQSYRTAQFGQLLQRWFDAPLTADDERVLRQWVVDWGAQPAALAELELEDVHYQKLAPLADRLAMFAGLLGQLVNDARGFALKGSTVVQAQVDVAQLREWLEPVDELMLAVVAPLLKLVANDVQLAESAQ